MLRALMVCTVITATLGYVGGCASSEAPEASTIENGSADGVACSIPAPNGVQCNPFCPDCGTGAHCTVVGKVLRCTSTGVRLDGDACTGTDQCAVGLGCFGIGDDTPRCHRLCRDGVPCRSGEVCEGSVVLEGGLTIGVCVEPPAACDLFGEPCPDEKTCQLGQTGAVCGAIGDLVAGTPCRNLGSSACAEGLQCVVVCTPICALSSASIGESEELCEDSCDAWTAVDDEMNVGVCTDGAPAAECQVLNGDCPLGQACYPLTVGWICNDLGNVAAEGSCTSTLECVEGHVCSDNRCRPFCIIESGTEAGCDAMCDDGYIPLEPVSWGLATCK